MLILWSENNWQTTIWFITMSLININKAEVEYMPVCFVILPAYKLDIQQTWRSEQSDSYQKLMYFCTNIVSSVFTHVTRNG